MEFVIQVEKALALLEAAPRLLFEVNTHSGQAVACFSSFLRVATAPVGTTPSVVHRSRLLPFLLLSLSLARAIYPNDIAMAKIFSLEGKALKLDSAADMDKHIADLQSNDDVEEVVFAGNTLGVDACDALAKVLQTKKKLKVRPVA
jgi:hypothetical protein